MKIKDKKEMAERFRLYGEIFMLCIEMKGEDLDDFEFYIWDIDEEVGINEFNIDVDDNDKGSRNERFVGFHFEEFVLWIDYGVQYMTPFFDVSSESLQKVLEALTKYKEVES